MFLFYATEYIYYYLPIKSQGHMRPYPCYDDTGHKCHTLDNSPKISQASHTNKYIVNFGQSSTNIIMSKSFIVIFINAWSYMP